MKPSEYKIPYKILVLNYLDKNAGQVFTAHDISSKLKLCRRHVSDILYSLYEQDSIGRVRDTWNVYYGKKQAAEAMRRQIIKAGTLRED